MENFLKAGYRLSERDITSYWNLLIASYPVLLDLPGHGRSTGLHGYVREVSIHHPIYRFISDTSLDGRNNPWYQCGLR